MELGDGTIKQLVKAEEFANGGINLTLQPKLNIWCRKHKKIDTIFGLVLNMLKEQKLISEGIEEHSLLRSREFDRSKVVLFAKNSKFFEDYNLPKELLMCERVLTEGDEELLNYLLENIINNSWSAFDKNFSTLDKIEGDSNIDSQLKDKLALFYSDYNSYCKKPYIVVMIEDISMFKNTRTIELLKRIYEFGRSKCIICCFGSIIDGNVEFLTSFINSNAVTLVDKMSDEDEKIWNNTNYFGLGDISKLDKLEDDDYLCIKGNLYDQGRQFGIKPYILTIREYKTERLPRKTMETAIVPRKYDLYNDDLTLLNTFPKELADYKYNLQEATLKYMANSSDLRRVVVKDVKTLVMDYLEFDNVDNYDILMFMNDNFTKIKNEFNYRIGEYLQDEKYRGKHLKIERCFSLGRNMEISEYIKLRQDDIKIRYDWQINAVIIAKCIKDLWNYMSEDNQITKFHFYKYPKEYRKKYGYRDEWTSEDLM